MNIKKIVFLLLFIVNFNVCFSQIYAKVDERFELTSIVFRLSEAEEYVNNEVLNYVSDIDIYFAKYKKHPLIEYIKYIREKDEVAYNAVSNFANHLKNKNNEFVLSEKDINCLVEYDLRWNKETLTQLVKLLNSFYRDSKFSTFYKNNNKLYSEAEVRFEKELKKIHFKWFESFFGKPLQNVSIYISLCNGRSNYALGNGILIGSSQTDMEGIPVFNYDDIAPVIIHELCHNFTNPIFLDMSEELKMKLDSASDIIYPYVKNLLEVVAYENAQAIYLEGFNNLFTNMYYRDYPSGFEKYNISNNENYGFIWMSRAMLFMESFYSNRNLYPTINEFIPELANFLTFTANNIEYISEEYKMKFPQITSIFPSLNDEIDSSIKEIRINFSHSMNNSFGILNCTDDSYVIPQFTITEESMLNLWSIDKRTLILPVILKEKSLYGFTLPKGIFQAESTHGLKEDFEVRFKTK